MGYDLYDKHDDFEIKPVSGIFYILMQHARVLSTPRKETVNENRSWATAHTLLSNSSTS